MKRKIYSILPFLFLLVASQNLWAQKSQLVDYKFSDEKIEVPDEFKEENEVILLKNVKIEIAVEKNAVTQFFLVHDKTQIHSDESIERNNRVYIPFRRDESLLLNKVRVIHPNGNITELNPKDIKEEKDEENGVNYHFYAINGLTKGAIIEKIFLIKESPDLEGNIIKIQEEHPIVKANFELVYPKHLVFKHKSYNGLAEAQQMPQEESSEMSKLTVVQENIPGILDDERYSNWDRYIMKFKYKLDQNLANNSTNLYNYLDFAKSSYDNMNKELDKNEQKALENFVKSIPKSNDPQEQIKFIENKVKSTINFNRYFSKNQNLEDVLKNKQSSGYFLLRLYTHIFKQMKIENEMVFTSKRYTLYFDKDFESNEQLNEVILYFPQIDEYMDFLALEYRLPMINFNYNGNYGLFVKGKELGGTKIGMGTVKKIKVPSSELTHDIQNITIDFTKNVEKPLVHAHYQFKGYSTLNFQPLKDFVPKDQYELIKKDYAKNYTVETEYKTLKFENEGVENMGFKPFILDATFEGTTQKAGNNILFKAGETIGKQMELYQEHKRILPVEIYYPHSYTRTLKILLPDGYSVKNLDSFNMDKKLNINGKTEAAFTSSYVQNGNEITVTNVEYYHVLDYPLDIFEEYRSVINAAADFNKISIVLTKD